MPLADDMRPNDIDEICGQKHILGDGKSLRAMILKGNVQNMIFYGPTGVGKTTVATLIAKYTKKKCIKLNGVNIGSKELKEVVKESNIKDSEGVVLFLDEIQYMNKKQQQQLLDVMESGRVTLIASTADNPYFVVYKALLSRSSIFEFKELSAGDILQGLRKAIEKIKSRYNSFEVEDKALEYIAVASNGDMRVALNRLELVINKVEVRGSVQVSWREVDEDSSVKIIGYDRDGDIHYDVLSAFHKSCRGSDENAAIHYLSRLIRAEDIQGISRRLLCLASEDIGLACPQAITMIYSCVQSAYQLGFPEARLPLAQATIYACRCPKSDSVTVAISNAQYDLEHSDFGCVPQHLRDSHYKSANKLGRGIGYKYPHNYKNHYVKQEYMPEGLEGREYYVFGDNTSEISMDKYWGHIKKS